MSPRARIGFLLACAGTIALYVPSVLDGLAHSSPGSPAPSDLATLDGAPPQRGEEPSAPDVTTSMVERASNEARH